MADPTQAQLDAIAQQKFGKSYSELPIRQQIEVDDAAEIATAPTSARHVFIAAGKRILMLDSQTGEVKDAETGAVVQKALDAAGTQVGRFTYKEYGENVLIGDETGAKNPAILKGIGVGDTKGPPTLQDITQALRDKQLTANLTKQATTLLREEALLGAIGVTAAPPTTTTSSSFSSMPTTTAAPPVTPPAATESPTQASSAGWAAGGGRAIFEQGQRDQEGQASAGGGGAGATMAPSPAAGFTGRTATLYDAAIKAGFTGDAALRAVATALAESKNSNASKIDDIETSIGDWQINLDAHAAKVPGNTLDEKIAFLKDPYNAATIAYQVSSSGTDFSPWSVWHETVTDKNGKVYQVGKPAAGIFEQLAGGNYSPSSGGSPSSSPGATGGGNGVGAQAGQELPDGWKRANNQLERDVSAGDYTAKEITGTNKAGEVYQGTANWKSERGGGSLDPRGAALGTDIASTAAKTGMSAAELNEFARTMPRGERVKWLRSMGIEPTAFDMFSPQGGEFETGDPARNKNLGAIGATGKSLPGLGYAEGVNIFGPGGDKPVNRAFDAQGKPVEVMNPEEVRMFNAVGSLDPAALGGRDIGAWETDQAYGTDPVGEGAASQLMLDIQAGKVRDFDEWMRTKKFARGGSLTAGVGAAMAPAAPAVYAPGKAPAGSAPSFFGGAGLKPYGQSALGGNWGNMLYNQRMAGNKPGGPGPMGGPKPPIGDPKAQAYTDWQFMQVHHPEYGGAPLPPGVTGTWAPNGVPGQYKFVPSTPGFAEGGSIMAGLEDPLKLQAQVAQQQQQGAMAPLQPEALVAQQPVMPQQDMSQQPLDLVAQTNRANMADFGRRGADQAFFGNQTAFIDPNVNPGGEGSRAFYWDGRQWQPALGREETQSRGLGGFPIYGGTGKAGMPGPSGTFFAEGGVGMTGNASMGGQMGQALAPDFSNQGAVRIEDAATGEDMAIAGEAGGEALIAVPLTRVATDPVAAQVQKLFGIMQPEPVPTTSTMLRQFAKAAKPRVQVAFGG